MKKKFRLLIIIFIFFIVLVVLNRKNIEKQYEVIRIKRYGEPINQYGMINNEYFFMDENNTKLTTKGLNLAIEYAKKNGIEYIELKNGEYVINDTIKLESNITLDLNGSTIIYETNSKTNYSVFNIRNVENVKLINGVLHGDKNTHDYSSIESTHEWGMGIDTRNSSNITISNVKIGNMTGDGVYISNNKDMQVNNCIISDNRRQGISVISGNNIEIFDNEIYTINGTNPKAGINCEANYDNEYCSNIKIYRNKIYNDKNLSILFEKNTANAEVFDNELEGTIYIINAKDSITIKDNVMKNGLFKADVPERKINNGFVINNVTVEGNKFYNVNFEFRNNNNVQLSNNEINEGTITMQNSKVNIINNNIKNSSVKDYLYNFEKSNLSNAIDGKNKSEVYLKGNKIIGQYKTLYKGNDYAKIIEENM